jgi:hypothetical protein
MSNEKTMLKIISNWIDEGLLCSFSKKASRTKHNKRFDKNVKIIPAM